MARGYQYDFSERGSAMYEVDVRQRKAQTMIRVLSDATTVPLDSQVLMNVGGSTGIIDEYLARYFKQVIGLDIDEKAIAYAQENFTRENLAFECGDAMAIDHPDASFDVVVCSQVYEHVPDASTLMEEMFRILKPGGVVYFAAGNRLMWNEPHYSLPLLSVLPRFLAHPYMRITGKGKYYYEKHFTYWGLKKLVSRFETVDYTGKMLEDPVSFDIDYMMKPGSGKQKIAVFIARYFRWLVPGYIWILRKPGN